MSFEFIILIILVVAGFAALFWVLTHHRVTDTQKDQGTFLLIQGQITAIKDKLTEHLSRELSSMRDEVNKHLRENRETQQKSTQSINENVFQFTKEITTLVSDLGKLQDEVKKVSTFQEIFKTPKLRGKWGEASLEHLLAQYFPTELYQRQYQFNSGDQVDAILNLPNGKILSIDAKFPSDNFAKMIETSDEANKILCRKNFIQDVKNQIDDIGRKYILPQEGTIEIALMYIPAESIYYELINNIKEVDLSEYAWSKRVVITSPNTFFLTLSVIQHWFRDIKISKQTQQVLKNLGRVTQDSEKLSDSFKRLGKHLKDTQGSFDDSENRLRLMTERIDKVIQVGELKEKVDEDIEVKPILLSRSKENN